MHFRLFPLPPAFLLALFALHFAAPRTVHAAPARVVVLETMPVRAITEHTAGLRAGLSEMGYREGEDLELVVLQADGDGDRAAALLEGELEQGRPAAVVTLATLATQTGYRVLGGKGIPQIFGVVTDPVGAGVIEAVGRPTGTHLTGRVYGVPRSLKLEMALRMLGRPPGSPPLRIGFLRSSYPSSVGDGRLLEAAAEGMDGLRVRQYEVPYRTVPEGLEAMLADCADRLPAIEGEVDVWWQPTGALGERPEFTSLLLERSRRPILYGNSLDAVRRGALFTVSPDYRAGGRELGLLVDAVLGGKDPGAIPPVASVRFVLGVNLDTAVEMGAVIPSDLLTLAGENVFRRGVNP